MREVVYTDRRDFLRRRLVRDEDGDEMAEYGVPAAVPDVEHELDWEGIIREINNILVQNNVTSRMELQMTGSMVPASNVVKRHLDELFYRLDQERKQGELTQD
jgi:hypothetical protein